MPVGFAQKREAGCRWGIEGLHFRLTLFFLKEGFYDDDDGEEKVYFFFGSPCPERERETRVRFEMRISRST